LFVDRLPRDYLYTKAQKEKYTMVKRVSYGRAAALVNNNPNQELKDRLEQRVLEVSSVLTSNTALTRAHAGSVILVDGSTGTDFTLTLPTPVVGMKFTFLWTQAPETPGQVMIDSGSGVLIKGNPSRDQNDSPEHAAIFSNRKIVPDGQDGTYLEIVAVNTTKWMIINSSGDTWLTAFTPPE
jgi:hypothetical protein